MNKKEKETHISILKNIGKQHKLNNEQRKALEAAIKEFEKEGSETNWFAILEWLTTVIGVGVEIYDKIK